MDLNFFVPYGVVVVVVVVAVVAVVVVAVVVAAVKRPLQNFYLLD